MGVKLGKLIAELTPEGLRDVNARTRKHLKVIEDASRIGAAGKLLSPPQGGEVNIGIGRDPFSPRRRQFVRSSPE